MKFKRKRFDLNPTKKELAYRCIVPTKKLLYYDLLVCTNCGADLKRSCWKNMKVPLHPLLAVPYCELCCNFYNSGEFSSDEDDGEEKYCRWCGQGGKMFMCSSCTCGFCATCIRKNVGPKYFENIRYSDDWDCLFCNVRPIWRLRQFVALASKDLAIFAGKLKDERSEEELRFSALFREKYKEIFEPGNWEESENENHESAREESGDETSSSSEDMPLAQRKAPNRKEKFRELIARRQKKRKAQRHDTVAEDEHSSDGIEESSSQTNELETSSSQANRPEAPSSKTNETCSKRVNELESASSRSTELKTPETTTNTMVNKKLSTTAANSHSPDNLTNLSMDNAVGEPLTKRARLEDAVAGNSSEISCSDERAKRPSVAVTHNSSSGNESDWGDESTDIDSEIEEQKRKTIVLKSLEQMIEIIQVTTDVSVGTLKKAINRCHKQHIAVDKVQNRVNDVINLLNGAALVLKTFAEEEIKPLLAKKGDGDITI